jgi:hypothetical protein
MYHIRFEYHDQTVEASEVKPGESNSSSPSDPAKPEATGNNVDGLKPTPAATPAVDSVPQFPAKNIPEFQEGALKPAQSQFVIFVFIFIIIVVVIMIYIISIFIISIITNTIAECSARLSEHSLLPVSIVFSIHNIDIVYLYL